MSIKILQWNINGIFNNYNELALLIKDHSPDVLCLQETHLPQNFNFICPKAYVGYFYNFQHNTQAKQGIGVLIKKHIPHEYKTVSSNLLCSFLELKVQNPITILNLYIHPNQQFSSSDLVQLSSNINTPMLILGDFNSWSPLWGSPQSNSRGKKIEHTLSMTSWMILNNGSPTHFSSHNSLTHVDLSLVSPQLYHNCSWTISNSLHGRDHFPITIQIISENRLNKTKPIPKYKTDLANWPIFATKCESLLGEHNQDSLNQAVARLTKSIRGAANGSIPQTKIVVHRSSVPWWNADLQKLRTEKQQYWHNYRRCMSTDNLLRYKNANAVFKKSVLAAKRDAFEAFTSRISPSSSTKKVWADIKTLTGVPPPQIKFLQHGNKVLSTEGDIAESFARTWSDYSSDSNFSPTYIENKNSCLSQILCPRTLSTTAKLLELDFTLLELETTLQYTKGRTPGSDRISYPMLKNLPVMAKRKLIEIYNTMLETGTYPHMWRLATIIPIPKPNKPPHKLDSYRPISLLSCLSKTIEKMIARRLMWFIDRHNLLLPKSSRF